MNMPVLPVTSSSPQPADASARGTDAAATTDTPAFSNVLSQRRDGAARPTESRPADARRTEGASGRADPDATERHEPLGPDETLLLILDSTALPLMQAAVPATETRPAHAGPAGRTSAADPRTARLPVDLAGRAAIDARDGATDAKAAGKAGADDHIRTPRADLAAPPAPANARAPLHMDTAAPAKLKESAHAAAPQFQSQAAGQTLAAQADAGSQAAESTVHARSAPGSESLQIPAQNAALASAAAPVGATSLPATAPTPAAALVAMPTPMFSPQWPQDFSRQILHLTQNLASAGNTVQMHVNPPELGPIHITLHVGDSIAQASFVSPHASVRQALENALPHLEQQLAQAGLSLGQADVGDQQPGQQAQGQATPARNGESTFSLDGQIADSTALPATSPAPRAASRPDALVDTFA